MSSEGQPASRDTRDIRVAIAVLGFLTLTTYGTLYYGITMIGPRIVTETGWSPALVYGGFSLAMVVAAVCATSIGHVVDEQGGRRVLFVGCLIGGLGFVILSLARSPAVYLLAWIVIGLGMASTFYDPAFATMARIAGTRTRRAISAVTLIGALASTVFWPVGLWLLRYMDWRSLCLIYAGLVGILCAAMVWLALPHEHRRTAAAGDLQPTEAEPAPLTGRLRLKAIALISFTITAHGLATNALSVHLVPTLDSLGLTEAQAVAAGTIIGPAQAAARLIEITFGGRYPVMALGLLATGLMPLAFCILFIGWMGAGLGLGAVMLFAVCYGLSNGLLTIARGVIPLALFGREGYGRTLGILAGPALVVKAGAPLVFALLLTHLGGISALAILGLSTLLSFSAMVILIVMVKRGSPATPSA
jgi:hypothetical protein